MRISDWSSDVCSSDLLVVHVLGEVDGQQLVRGLELHQLGLGLLHASLQLAELRLEEAPHLVHGAVEALAAGAHEERSEEIRVGNECVSTYSSRWSQSH